MHYQYRIDDCPLEQQSDGKWVCPQCGWTYHKRLRRTCTGGSAIDPQARVWRRLEELSLKDEERVKIAARLEVCFGGCEKLVGGVCIDWPKPCKRMDVWLTRLAFGSCKEWDK